MAPWRWLAKLAWRDDVVVTDIDIGISIGQ